MPITVYKSDIATAKLQYKEFLSGKAGGFTAGLFELIPHADIGNRRKLSWPKDSQPMCLYTCSKWGNWIG